jgi:hypothetical protein
MYNTKMDVERPRWPFEMEQSICGLSEVGNVDLQIWKPIHTEFFYTDHKFTVEMTKVK